MLDQMAGWPLDQRLTHFANRLTDIAARIDEVPQRFEVGAISAALHYLVKHLHEFDGDR